MKYIIKGAFRETGADVVMTIEAKDQKEAEEICCKQGILINSIEPETMPHETTSKQESSSVKLPPYLNYINRYNSNAYKFGAYLRNNLGWSIGVILMLIVAMLFWWQQAHTPGSVILKVTWKYNDVLGNRPDVGAKVWLVPRDGDMKWFWLGLGTIDESDASSLQRNSNRLETKYINDKSVTQFTLYGGEIGGDGTLSIQNVEPQEYRCYILSKNANSEFDQRKENTDLLKRLDSETRWLDGFEKHNYTCDKKLYNCDVQVFPGKNTTVSYDFGYTFSER